ncbi:hypothetical protein MLD38_031250 [Melastoma candidum]|uniref:Uncharacterized protein n=1 Tax=Melastoma candidum TaxID=119954 RepID=A0ACB9MQD5_9MYRT|nr:hypothetical protein MLD38_031250 [Melastoma candidum]
MRESISSLILCSTPGFLESITKNHVRTEAVVSRPATIWFKMVSVRNLSLSLISSEHSTSSRYDFIMSDPTSTSDSRIPSFSSSRFILMNSAK